MDARRLLAGLLILAAPACVPPRVAGAPSRPAQLGPPHPEPELVMVQHRVGPGETLYRIARTYGLPADALAAANDVADPRSLQVGQLLVIPGATEVKKVVPPGAQEAGEAARLEGLARARAGEENATGVRPAAVTPKGPPPPPPLPPVSKVKVSDPQRAGPLAWPLRGVLYARFGRKGTEPHDGIDLAAPVGTPVKTAAAGTVLYAGEQPGYGFIALVAHDNGLVTLYAHNRDVRVREGQAVREGQVVATVGETGKTSGPHLHFEVRKGGLPVDPLLYLGPVPAAP